MIKTNCELPLCMFKENMELNDFDFVLFHLYESNQRYKEYFLNMRKTNPNRIMILDNSAYEFFVKGEELNVSRYKEVIQELNPDFYILPDKLMDRFGTAEEVLKFYIDMPKNTTAKPMAVIQGNSVRDLTIMMAGYNAMGLTNICIPFHNAFFKDMGESCDEDIMLSFEEEYNQITDDIRYSMGRVQFVRDYTDKLKEFDYVHFLGSHCPYEKTFYKDFDSMDTGYPVKLGYNIQSLGSETEKPNIIIDDFINTSVLTPIKYRMIYDNVVKFREY